MFFNNDIKTIKCKIKNMNITIFIGEMCKLFNNKNSKNIEYKF